MGKMQTFNIYSYGLARKMFYNRCIPIYCFPTIITGIALPKQ